MTTFYTTQTRTLLPEAFTQELLQTHMRETYVRPIQATSGQIVSRVSRAAGEVGQGLLNTWGAVSESIAAPRQTLQIVRNRTRQIYTAAQNLRPLLNVAAPLFFQRIRNRVGQIYTAAQNLRPLLNVAAPLFFQEMRNRAGQFSLAAQNAFRGAVGGIQARFGNIFGNRPEVNLNARNAEHNEQGAVSGLANLLPGAANLLLEGPAAERNGENSVESQLFVLTWQMVARHLNLSEEERNMSQVVQIDQWINANRERLEGVTELNFNRLEAPFYLPALHRIPLPNLERLTFSGKIQLGNLVNFMTFADQWPQLRQFTLSNSELGPMGMMVRDRTDLVRVSQTSKSIFRSEFEDLEAFKKSALNMMFQSLDESIQSDNFQAAPQKTLDELLRARIKKKVWDVVTGVGNIAVVVGLMGALMTISWNRPAAPTPGTDLIPY